MSRRNILIVLGVILLGGALVAANLWYKKETGLTVTTEVVKTRDLEAVVSASGKIQPKRLVKISAETSGRVVDLAVNEGDRIKKGQFLLQIDPKNLRTRVDSGEASLQVAASSLEQMRQAIETARTQLEQPRVQLEQMKANLKRQQDLWSRELTTRESLEKAENDVMRAESDVKAAQSALQEREKTAKAQDSRIMQERATLENARYDLGKVRIESTIDGIVTRRNIQEGETAVIGTMNNAGTVLLELADMSVIQAEVEVDETNIPNVQLGQPAKISIDAIPERTFKGHVSEIGNSPIQAAAGRGRHPGDEFQGGGHPRRAGARRAARIHLHRRHHDRHPAARHRRSDSRGRRPRADLRRRRPDREGAAPRQAAQTCRADDRRRPSSSRVRRARRPKASSPSATAPWSSSRSSWGSPATSTSRCCRASRSRSR